MQTTIGQTVCSGVRNLRACTRVSVRPIPQWAALEGCTAVALMSEYDDARQARRQCARACGALTRVRRACLWRAQQAVPTSTDPMGILKITREFKASGAGKEHTSGVRGGGRDPGVRRPGSGLGRPTARSKFFQSPRLPIDSVTVCPCPLPDPAHVAAAHFSFLVVLSVGLADVFTFVRQCRFYCQVVFEMRTFLGCGRF